jgi:hypothetical protein
MSQEPTHVPTAAAFFAIAAVLAGLGALAWRINRHSRETRALPAKRRERPGLIPVWAQATAIVASSVGELLLLTRQKA